MSAFWWFLTSNTRTSKHYRPVWWRNLFNFFIFAFIERMSKLIKRYWLEADDFFNSTWKNNGKINKGILPTALIYSTSPQETSTPNLPRLEILPQQNSFCKKPKQMQKNQYLDLFVICRQGFDRNTGHKNRIFGAEEPSITQRAKSSPLVFESVKNNYHFPPLNHSNIFGTVDYDPCLKTNVDSLPAMCNNLRPCKNLTLYTMSVNKNENIY